MRRVSRSHGFAWLAVFWSLTVACGTGQPVSSPSVSNTESRTTGTRGGTAVYRMTSAPTTFNYLLADDEPSVVTAFFLLNSRLVDFDHRSRTYVPALAESWQTASDGRTVDIKLREGLKFSDSRPLTADDVVFTLAAIYDERTNSPAFRDSLLIDGRPIEVRAIDSLRLQLIFPQHVAAVENYLINFAVLPSHALKADFESGKLAEVWKINSEPKMIVTSGAFVVESLTPGERVTLVRNPHFWKRDAAGTQLPYLDKLVLEIVADPNKTLSSLNQNALDLADRIRPTDYVSLTSASGPVKAVDMGPGMGTDYLWFNLNRSKKSGEQLDDKPKFRWFSDKRFRQAVSFAIDRNSISSTALRGLATPIYGFVSPANGIWADPNIPKTEYDLDKARQQLKDAGFSFAATENAPELLDDAGNRVEFTLLVPAGNEPRVLMAAVIQEDLARLGIKMQVVQIEFQAISERWSKSFDYDAILLGLAVTDFEPSSFANFLLSSGATHQWQPLQKTPATEWEARIDTLFAQQAREADPKKRAEIFREIQNIVVDESPIIPIAAGHILSAASTRIGNYSPSIIMPHSLWNAEELFVKQGHY